MTIALVHQTHAVTSSGGSTTKAITIPAPAAGNTLIVQLGDTKTSSLITSTKQGTTALTLVASKYDAAPGNFLETWVLSNCGTGTTVNIVVNDTYTTIDVLVSEWSGMPTSYVLDGSAGNTDFNTTITTSTITPTATGPVLVLAHAMAVTHTISAPPGNGFTEFSDTNGTTNRCAFAYKILSAGAAVSTSWTKNASYGTASLLIVGLDGASSVSSTTLTLGSASFAETGSSASPKIGRELALSTGAFALSGSAVGPKIGRALALATGAFSILGAAVNASIRRAVALASGAFAVSGSGINISIGRYVGLASGTFTVNCTPLSLAISRKLAIAAGNFTVTGSNVGTSAGKTLSLASGAFSQTDSPLSIQIGRRATLTSGAFHLTGQALTLTVSGGLLLLRRRRITAA